jgi:hypothetical protein
MLTTNRSLPGINRRLKIVAVAAALSVGPMFAQNSANPETLQLSAKPANHAYDPSTFFVRALGVNKPGVGRTALPKQDAQTRSMVQSHLNSFSNSSPHGSNGVDFYPGDLTDYFGGPTVFRAQSHNLYVDCGKSCFGNPSGFQNDLYDSNFIHVVDQYVGSSQNDRYKVGFGGTILYPISGTLGDLDLIEIVYAGATAKGPFNTGYKHIYNVYLPQGVDFCSDAVGGCYSPDNDATWVFCAFHGSIDFSDIGHVLFTFIPYQNVAGCSVTGATPNGVLADSTDSTLSHETFETITDPDGTAWWNFNDLVLFGEEIGDECVNSFGIASVVKLSGQQYAVQSEYSNSSHACTYSPN